MARFNYLILSLNKILQIYYIVFTLSGLGAKTMCQEQKGGDGIKTLKNTGPK